MAGYDSFWFLNGLPRTAVDNFWSPNRYGVDPQVPNLPLETSGSYLWRIARAGAAASVVLAACAAPDYAQAKTASWPFGRVTAAGPSNQPFHIWQKPAQVRLEAEGYRQPPLLSWPFSRTPAPVSGVIVGLGPASIILLPSLEIRQPAPLSWPFGRAALPSAQPFHIWQKPAQVRLEVEGYRQPAPLSWPWNRFAQPSQPFHAWRNPPIVRLEAEGYGQPVRYSWPWNRFAQPFQPLFFYGLPKAAPLAVDAYRIPARASWPFGMATGPGPSTQPFHIWQKLPVPRLEAEGYAQPVRYSWPWNRFAQPFQPLFFYGLPKAAPLLVESSRNPVALSWPFGRAAPPAGQPFHIWQKPAQVRLEVEGYRQPAPLSWPWNRFAQPFQPLFFYGLPKRVQLEPEQVARRGVMAWRFTAVVQPFQPLLTWPGIKAARILEPEGYAIPQQLESWPFGVAVSYGQPFMVWAVRPRTVLEDGPLLRPAAPGAWPFGNSYSVPVLVGSHLVVYPCEDRVVEPGLARTVRPKR